MSKSLWDKYYLERAKLDDKENHLSKELVSLMYAFPLVLKIFLEFIGEIDFFSDDVDIVFDNKAVCIEGEENKRPDIQIILNQKQGKPRIIYIESKLNSIDNHHQVHYYNNFKMDRNAAYILISFVKGLKKDQIINEFPAKSKYGFTKAQFWSSFKVFNWLDFSKELMKYGKNKETPVLWGFYTYLTNVFHNEELKLKYIDKIKEKFGTRPPYHSFSGKQFIWVYKPTYLYLDLNIDYKRNTFVIKLNYNEKKGDYKKIKENFFDKYSSKLKPPPKDFWGQDILYKIELRDTNQRKKSIQFVAEEVVKYISDNFKHFKNYAKRI
jgi:hypothetical protein